MQLGSVAKFGAGLAAVPLIGAGALLAHAVIDRTPGTSGHESNAGYPADSGDAPLLWEAIQGARTLASAAAGRLRAADTAGITAEQPGASPVDDATAAWKAMSSSAGVRGMPGAFAAAPGAPYHASVWAMSQVFNAALDQAGRTGNWAEVNAMTKRMASLYGDETSWSDGLPYLPTGSKLSEHPFYDDNAWVVLDLLQAHDMTGDASWLQRAEEMTTFLDTGVREDGAVLWGRDVKPSINTCAAGPVGQVYAKLYAATGKPEYLEKAQRIEQYLVTNMRDENGMYWDNKDLTTGEIEYPLLTYNQGTPIGLQLELYRATGDASYLEKARQTAKSSVEHWTKDGESLWKHAPVFNGIFFRNLLALDQVSPDPAYGKLLDDYLQRATAEGLDRATGLYKNGGMGSYDGKSSGAVIDQSAMVQMFELAGGADPHR